MDVVPVETARRQLGSLVTAAATDGTVTVISKNGVPAAAIVPLRVVQEMESVARKDGQ